MPMDVCGAWVKDGIPYINGKRAIKCPDDDSLVKMMGGALAPWLCPECKAHLAGGSLICMSACHLNAAQFQRFQGQMAECAAKVRAEDAACESVAKKLME